jgi:hypothetical protein
MTEKGKLRKAILSAFYNNLQRNFGILLILRCSFKLWWNFCPDLSRSKFHLKGERSIKGRCRETARSTACEVNFGNVQHLLDGHSNYSDFIDREIPDYLDLTHCSWELEVTRPWLQWRNVISGGPRLTIFEGPPSRSAKGTSWAPYMHEFSRGSRACSSGKFLNLDSLKCHFLDFGGRFYRILMVRKRHCNISEALANVFALSPVFLLTMPKPGGPHLAHWGWGPPGSPGLSP